MNRTISPAPVRRTVTVKASQARAFEVFTASIGRWWPKSHRTGASELDTVVIEPMAGGRWFERGVDGVETQVGHVLAWNPPSGLILAWQLTAEWRFDPDLITEVEIRFIVEGPGVTRVELEHRNLERFGDKAEAVSQSIGSPNGWGAILDLYAQSAGQ